MHRVPSDHNRSNLRDTYSSMVAGCARDPIDIFWSIWSFLPLSQVSSGLLLQMMSSKTNWLLLNIVQLSRKMESSLTTVPYWVTKRYFSLRRELCLIAFCNVIIQEQRLQIWQAYKCSILNPSNAFTTQYQCWHIRWPSTILQYVALIFNGTSETIIIDSPPINTANAQTQ